jgi:RNA ligase (TIGR02306 family)
MDNSLVYIGKIIDIAPIPGADFIVSITVVCGKGGKWRGVGRKSEFNFDDLCVVYLPDSMIAESPDMQFMAKSNWRVRMQHFRCVPSEVLIMPLDAAFRQRTMLDDCVIAVGEDITQLCGVTKYHKPVPEHLNGLAKGYFPSFIPKTDEPNYQTSPELVDELHGQPYYVTEKCDGSSTTAYRHNSVFGVCSRNLELEQNEKNGYWRVALKYELDKKLPESYALQWETCGPGIQSNPMQLQEIDGFAFSAYKIDERRYLDMKEFFDLCEDLKFPCVQLVGFGREFDKSKIDTMGEGKYSYGPHSKAKEREGVVVRSQVNVRNGAPISFKVINLNYDN